ncbi:MAG: hypothetical protein K2J00_05725 [Bacteroidaceae bacterium]|nr:hypothetical protein [Bacteroidaceae bacterium]
MKAKIVLMVFIGMFSVNVPAQTVLSDEQLATIEQRVLERVRDFMDCLPEIAAKGNKTAAERENATRYIQKALKLCIGNGNEYKYQDAYGNTRIHAPVTMQTTSRGRANPPKPMKRYLNSLMALPYQHVEIDVCEAIRLDKKLHQVAPDSWEGSATILQVFRAETGDGLKVIDDVDKKQITVYVNREVIDLPGGDKEEFWIVMLGDMRVANKYNR